MSFLSRNVIQPRRRIRYFLFVLYLLTIPFLKFCIFSVPQRNDTQEIHENFPNGNILIGSKFLKALKNFPWKSFIQSYQNKGTNVPNFANLTNQLFLTLLPYLIEPPQVPVNTSCHPPPLNNPLYAKTCRLLKQSRKVAALFAHGMDADTLEILFQELHSVVDRFFLLESTKSYYLGIKKPLIWEHLKTQERFKPFLEKVVHFVMDDGDIIYQTWQEDTTFPYRFQHKQEILLWYKFLNWNRENGNYFGGDDLLSFSDLDEVPLRSTVHNMKHCELPSDPIDIGSWFPYGNVNQIFKSDYPVHYGSGYSFAAPTFWTLKTVIREMREMPVPGSFRRRGNNTRFLFGGMHMTSYEYIPYKLAKTMTEIESFGTVTQAENIEKLKNVENLLNKLEVAGSGNFSEMKILDRISSVLRKKSHGIQRRIVKLAEFEASYPQEFGLIVKLPWFYVCNKDRYPSWEGKQDSRLF